MNEHRRRLLALLGTAGVTHLAGCGSDDDGGTDDPRTATETLTQTPTETSIPTETATTTDTPTEESSTPTSTSDPNMEWRAVAGAKRGNGHHYPAPAVLGETLVVPSGLNQAGIVEGFDLETGGRKWELSFDDSMISDQPYLPTDGSVAVVETHSGLTAITENGEIEWSEDLRPTGDPLGINNTIFVPTSRGVEAREFDGTQKWTWESESSVYDLGYADGSIYTKAGTSLYSISSGETEWEYRTTIEPSTPPVAHDGLVFIGTEDSRLVAINVDESTVEWEQDVGNSIAAPLTIGEYVYAAGWSYPLKAYNPTDGTTEWTFDPTYQTISAAVEKDETVYVGSSNHLFAKDANDGQPMWSYSVDSAVWAPPAIDDNTVYVTTENGAVICLTL